MKTQTQSSDGSRAASCSLIKTSMVTLHYSTSSMRNEKLLTAVVLGVVVDSSLHILFNTHDSSRRVSACQTSSKQKHVSQLKSLPQRATCWIHTKHVFNRRNSECRTPGNYTS